MSPDLLVDMSPCSLWQADRHCHGPLLVAKFALSQLAIAATCHLWRQAAAWATQRLGATLIARHDVPAQPLSWLLGKCVPASCQGLQLHRALLFAYNALGFPKRARSRLVNVYGLDRGTRVALLGLSWPGAADLLPCKSLLQRLRSPALPERPACC